MEALQRLVPQGLPVSLQVIAVTLFLGFLYSYITKDRLFAGFPVIALDGKSPKDTWTWNGRKVAEEGVRRVCRGHAMDEVLHSTPNDIS